MKKFLVYVAMIAILIFATLGAVEYVLRQIPNRYRAKAQYMEQNCKDIDILVFGSSHACMGIDPAQLSLNAYNLANVSQSLDYDYYLLQKYIDRCPKLQKVVVSVSVFSFYSLLKNSDQQFLGIYKQEFGISQIEVPLKYRFETLYGTDVWKKLFDYYLRKRDVV